jgi:tetratricopeptide (TPR) repeat protein
VTGGGRDEDRWHALTAQGRAFLHAQNGLRLHDIGSDLIACDAGHPRGYRYRAEAACCLENYKEAIVFQREALARDPQNPFLLTRLAVFLYQAKDYRKAEAPLHAALALDPTSADTWKELAEVYYWRDEVSLMEAALARSLELDPGNADALHLRARAADVFSAVSRPETVAHFERALAADPEDGFTHGNLGISYLERGAWALAETHLREALRLEPNETAYQEALYRCLNGPSFVNAWVTRPLFAVARVGAAVSRRIPPWGVLLFVLLVLLPPIWVLLGPLLFLWLLVLVVVLGYLLPIHLAWHAALLADTRAAAGGGRAGWLWFRRWPRPLRRALPLVVAIGLPLLVYALLQSDAAVTALLFVVMAACLVYLCVLVRDSFRWVRDRLVRRRWRRRLEDDAR